VLEFDEQTARQVESAYTTPDVVEQRRAFRAAIGLEPGERVLDIGSGPGFLAAEMAEEVGPEGRVVGVDPSETMLAMARARAPGATTEFRSGDALALPFPDESFDVAVSTQVYEYVEDVATALAEARRVLRPGGRLLILDTDWDSIVWHSSDPQRMRRVLEAWNEHLADPYLPRRLPGLLAAAGLELRTCSVIPLLNRTCDRNAFSCRMVDVIAGFVPGRGAVSEAETTAWAEDLRGMGADYFFSLNRYVFAATR
jgi:arsenite methyltransferase